MPPVKLAKIAPNRFERPASTASLIDRIRMQP